jgi:hypothetical protein
MYNLKQQTFPRIKLIVNLIKPEISCWRRLFIISVRGAIDLWMIFKLFIVLLKDGFPH